jgi:phenylalanine-4-hydroxylase
VYDRLAALHTKYACNEFLHSFGLMRRYCGYSNSRIPQAQDISEFLQAS